MTDKKQIGIDPTSIAGRAIASVSKKPTAQTAKHKSDLSFNPAIHKKQTAEEWLLDYKTNGKEIIEFNENQRQFVGWVEVKKAFAMARAEEREKCKYDFNKMFVDAAKDAEEEGRRETAKEIKAWFLEIELLLPEEEKEFDKRFLSKDKEAKP